MGMFQLWILSFVLSVVIAVCCQSRTYSPLSHDQIEMTSTTSEKPFVRPIMDGGFAWDGKLEHVIPIDVISYDDDQIEMASTTSEKPFVPPIMDGGFAWDGKVEHMIPNDAFSYDDDQDLL